MQILKLKIQKTRKSCHKNFPSKNALNCLSPHPRPSSHKKISHGEEEIFFGHDAI